MKKLSVALIIFAVVAAKISFHQTGEQVLDFADSTHATSTSCTVNNPRYFDENLIFTHMSGKKQTHAEFIGEIMDGTLNYYKIDTKDFSIRVDGERAVMSVTHTLTAKVYGIRGAWTLSGNSVYEKRGGIWVRVNN